MYTLKILDEEISCDKVVKGQDYIHCYQDGEVTAQFSGISDFSGYALTDEDGNPVSFPEPELDDATQLLLFAVDHEFRLTLLELGVI